MSQTSHHLPSIVAIHERIHLNALAISSRYKKTEVELIEALQQVESHKVYLHQGYSSLFQYTVNALHLSESVSYNLITVMRKAKEVPALKAKLADGSITLTNARKIVPVITSINQEEWLEKATQLSQRQLEKEVIKIRPETATPERVRYTSVSNTEARVMLEVGLSENEMMKIRRVQNLVSQATSTSASLEDTLIAMTNLYLKHRDPLKKAKRIYIKKGFPIQSPVALQAHFPKPKLSAKREPIPAPTLHQVNLRDERCCTFINEKNVRCAQSRWIEIHHKIPVSVGGKNELNNLITLCSDHHEWTHKFL